MKERLIFIGGIHGVGKSHFAGMLATFFGAQHVVASNLIRTFKELLTYKYVDDVEENQDLLVLALRNLERTSNVLLLDGHYCLIGASNRIEEVPIRTFQQLDPTALILLTDEIGIIRDRLGKRDGSTLCEELLGKLQNSEIEHAQTVSTELGISLDHLVAPGRADVDNPRMAALFRG